MAADLLSRGGPLPGEWRLHPDIVQAIWDLSAGLRWTSLPPRRLLIALGGIP